jgi:chloramphenicol 3-O-phosphotransferase
LVTNASSCADALLAVLASGLADALEDVPAAWLDVSLDLFLPVLPVPVPDEVEVVGVVEVGVEVEVEVEVDAGVLAELPFSLAGVALASLRLLTSCDNTWPKE